MSEKKSYILFKVAKEFNLGTDTICNDLAKHEFEIDNNPNSKLSAEMYNVILKKYGKNIDESSTDKKQKTETESESDESNNNKSDDTPSADDLLNEIMGVGSLLTDTPVETPKKEELKSKKEEISEEKVEKIEVSKVEEVSKPEKIEKEVEPEEKKLQPEIKKEEKVVEKTEENAEEKKTGGLKVLGKIDLSKTSSTRKKKTLDEKIKPKKEKKTIKKKKAVEQASLFDEPETKKVEELEKKEKTPEVKKEEVEETKKTEKAPKTVEKKEEEIKVKKQEKTVEKIEEKVEKREKRTEKTIPDSEEKVKKANTEEENTVIRASDHTPKLTGPKVLGKIDLSEFDKKPKKKTSDDKSNSNTDDNKKRKKRKRKHVAVSSNNNSNNNNSSNKDKPNNKDRNNNKDRRNTKDKKGNNRNKKQLSNREVNKNISQTLNKKSSRVRQKRKRDRRKEGAVKREMLEQEMLEQESVLEVTEFLSANELAEMMNISVNDVIAQCMNLGYFVSINQRLESELITIIAEEFGFGVEFVDIKDEFETYEEEDDELENTENRPPIVTVMGHVDHGKTSLLDFIRNENVIAGEAGGITQHIGAYEVTLKNGKEITFLDTPGHEAFTAMRARGAQVTDIAIIVIAADDAVMPQTIEAITHAQSAEVPMVFAINKIDKDGANPEKIREQLANMNILVEDWGGNFQIQEISAKQGIGIDDLLEKVILEAEMLELRANSEKTARGTVIEAKKEKGKGIVTTVLVQNGTLKMGDSLVAGACFGRIKAMMDERSHRVKKAGPSTPVQILGLQEVPQAGDKFFVYEEESKAKEVANHRQQLLREQTFRNKRKMGIDDLLAQDGDKKTLNLIVKGDVDGSVEALSDSLLKLSNEEIQVNIVLRGVGGISESDVYLATSSKAIIIGFQVRPSVAARQLAETEGVEIRLHNIIYDVINEVTDVMEGLLSPEIQIEISGEAEIRETFKITKIGTIAGCMVKSGKIKRDSEVNLIRDGKVIYTGKLASLKRFKDDVPEVAKGYECGMSIENYNDLQIGDVIEAFEKKEVKRKL